jgi:hypothetical protein
LEEGEGETSGVAKENPSPPPDPGSHVILIGEGTPEIPDRGSVIKSPRGPSNQSPQIEHPAKKSLKAIGIFLTKWHNKIHHATSDFHFGIS